MAMSSGVTWCALVLLPTGLLACGDAGAEGTLQPSSFTRTDSAGVILSVTPGRDARASLNWTVDSVPNLVIGAGDSPDEVLYRVQGVRGFPDGRILVVNGGTAELRFFDSEGRLLERAGGRGKGPGEFVDPVLVSWGRSDSLLLFDAPLLRYQVFSSDGRYARTVRLDRGWPVGRTPPAGAAGTRFLINRRPFIGGEASVRKPGLHQIGWDYSWFDPASAEEVPVESFIIDSGFKFRGWSYTVPFLSPPTATIMNGEALVTGDRMAEIRGYDSVGRLRRVLRIQGPRRPVTQAILAAVDLEEAAPRGTPPVSRRAILARLPIPDTLPVFRSLRADEVGWLWAEVYDWQRDRPKQWMVFDPEGRARGIVETPPGLDVRFIGRDYILGVWRDGYRVEYVRRHALRRNRTTKRRER